MKNENRGRDIFYGVVAVATLIVAIVGATLAYFSVSVSSNEGAVNAQAATVSITYNDGQQITAQANELIPADFDEVVKVVYEEKVKDIDPEQPNAGNACIDSNSRQVCSVYRFSVQSDLEREIVATLNNEHNGFTYLSYAMYDVTGNKWLELNNDKETNLPLTSCSNEDEDDSNDCWEKENEEAKKVYDTAAAVNSLFGITGTGVDITNTKVTIANTEQVYDLVLFIKENEDNQNIDQGKKYSGTIMVDVVDSGMSGQITGCVGDDC